MTIADILILTFEVIGLGISLYLIFKNYKVKPPVCMIGHDCGAVLNSKYSRFMGLKMETYGVLYYLTAITLFVSQFYLIENTELINNLFMLLVSTGLLVSIVLTYIQVKVIRSLCTWCLCAAITNALLFVTVTLERVIYYL